MATTRQSEPGARTVLQRVRNRIIEYFELVSSFEEQRKYQAQASIDVLPEIVNQWEDWVIDGWESSFLEPVFSDEERSEIARFGRTWLDVANRLPHPLPSLAEVQCTDAWLQLRESAERARRVFERRGRLAEE